MAQFTKKSFARGVLLTTQHVQTPADAVATAMASASVDGNLPQAPWRLTLNMPWIDSSSMEYQTGTDNQKSCILLPFVMPPPQEAFDSVSWQQPVNFPTLKSVSLSFDQRAEPYAVTDQYCAASFEGYLTNTDMDRYTLTLELLERLPTILGGTETDFRSVYKIVIPGEETYGNQFVRQNPYLINELNLPINPLRTYVFRLTAHGLYSDNVSTERLALPSFTLSLAGTYPLMNRDTFTPNAPDKTDLLPQTAAVTIPTLVPNQLIDGTSDLQAMFSVFDQHLADRLQSGISDESELAVAEQLDMDAAYSIIAVPMWGSTGQVRCRNATGAGLPYLSGVAPETDPTCDRRVIPVPTGFTVHHIVVVQNLVSYPSPLTTTFAGFGGDVGGNNLYHKVGVSLLAINDHYANQQIGYLEWTRPTIAHQIDLFKMNGTEESFRLHNMPLVAPAGTNNVSSYTLTGNPVYCGSGNSTTDTRNQIGQMPEVFGAGALQSPSTNGIENLLEIRWLIQDAVDGLSNALTLDNVLVGTGGHWVYIIGKQILHRRD